MYNGSTYFLFTPSALMNKIAELSEDDYFMCEACGGHGSVSCIESCEPPCPQCNYDALVSWAKLLHKEAAIATARALQAQADSIAQRRGCSAPPSSMGLGDYFIIASLVRWIVYNIVNCDDPSMIPAKMMLACTDGFLKEWNDIKLALEKTDEQSEV